MLTSPKKGERRGGRQKGTPNRSTSLVREALARFMNRRAGRFAEWLDTIADGVPRRQRQAKDENGALLTNADGSPLMETEWVVPPNPIKAFELTASLLEYHIPKLQRTELSGELNINRDVEEMSDAELLAVVERERAAAARRAPPASPPDPSKIN